MSKLSTCACLAMLIVAVAAVVKPIPSTSVNVLSMTQTINIDGSEYQCCSGGAQGSSSSSISQTTYPLNFASTNLTGSCSGDVCECYSAQQLQTFIDITPLYEQCKGGTVLISCNNDEDCDYSALNISYVRAEQGIHKNGYWPWPYNQACVNNTSSSACINFTYLPYTAQCSGFELPQCTATLPLVSPALTGGALLITINAEFSNSCGYMECNSADSNSYFGGCQLTSMTCP